MENPTVVTAHESGQFLKGTDRFCIPKYLLQQYV